jgi:hypothetical protein
MKSTTFAALFLLVAGCSGSTTDGANTNGSELERKRIAAEQAASGTSAGDACAENEWYGDGVCDSFCAEADTDCVPGNPGGDDPIVCALFVEESDGACRRPGDDPCRFQDPDCEADDPVEPDPDEPVACAAISEVADGVCSRPEDDPCRTQDPDCIEPTDPPAGGYDCDLSNVACEIVEPTCGEGEVPTANGFCYGPCVPKDQCADPGGVVCAAYIEESDGVCSRAEGDPCRSQDPDCDVACTLIIEESDGVCSRADNDPCRGQDPDCDVACAEYIEEPDGECTRPASDPCKFQDPDCG